MGTHVISSVTCKILEKMNMDTATMLDDNKINNSVFVYPSNMAAMT